MAQGNPLVDGTVSLEVEGRPPAPHRPHRTVAQTLGRRARTVQHCLSPGQAIPLPRQQDPQPLGSPQPGLTAATMENPLRRNSHGGFGERPKRTGSNPGTAPQADSTVGREDAAGLGGQELVPGRATAAGRGINPGVMQNLPTVEAAIGWPNLTSSPCTRRCPHAGLSVAMRITSLRIAATVEGRPGCRRPV